MTREQALAECGVVMPDTMACRRCGGDAPMCGECETYHCAGCDHPPSYTTCWHEPRACGCVDRVQRNVSRRRDGSVVVTFYTAANRPSVCTTHTRRKAAAPLTDAERANLIAYGTTSPDTGRNRVGD